MPYPLTEPDWDLPEVPAVDQATGTVLCSETTIESSDLKEEDLQVLADFARSHNLPGNQDVDLIKFLHSCDYDTPRAKDCLKAFHSCRRNTRELFSDWDINSPSMLSIFEQIVVAIIPRRTPQNYRVVVSGLRHSDATKYVFADVCRTLLMILESIFLTEPTIDGVVFIHNMDKATFGHFLKFGWTLPKKLGSYFLTGLPLKQRETYIVNCSSFVDRGLSFVRHIGKKEDWDRVHVYKGNDLDDLHKRLPKYCLPSDLGGTLPSMVELHDMTVKRLGAFKDIYRIHLPE